MITIDAELFYAILSRVIAKNEVQISFPDFAGNLRDVAESEAVCLLEQIKAVIANDSLSDFDCVEAIVCLFEEAGCGCKGRHDFG